MARSKLKTLKPLRKIQCYTVEEVLANATASWNRMWDLVDAIQEPLMDTTKIHAKLQACLDNGDFGEGRVKVEPKEA